MINDNDIMNENNEIINDNDEKKIINNEII